MTALRVLQINLNHDARAQDLCLAEADKQGTDLILLSEPYVSRGRIRAPGWTVHHQGRAAILVRSGHQCTLVTTSTEVHLAAVIIEGVLVCSCYAPPLEPLQDILEELELLLASRVNPAILGGDFNCRSSHVTGSRSNARGELLDALIDSRGLYVHNIVDCHTWERFREGRLLTSIIDYTLSTSATNVSDWNVLETDSLSDHRYITYTITAAMDRPTSVDRCRMDGEQLRRILQDANIRTLPAGSDISDIDQYVAYLTDLLQKSAQDASIPAHRVPPTGQWWNEDLERLREIVRLTSYHVRRTRNPLRKAVFAAIQKQLQRGYRIAIRRCKEEGWRRFCNSSEPWGRVYRSVVKKHSKSTQEVIQLRKPDGSLTTSSEEAAVLLLDSKFPLAINATPAWPPEIDVDIPADCDVSSVKVSGIVKNLDNKKAPGLDGISNKVIKVLNEEHPSVLPALFSTCLKTGYFPRSWKQGRVVFIPKDGKDPETTDGYRPITLLSGLGKTLERVIQTQIETHLEGNNYLHVNQFGFRKHRSTEQAVNLAVDTIRTYRANHRLVAALSLDIKGAFDHVSWSVVLDQLARYEVPAYLRRMIASYFCDRHTQYGGAERVLERGCPQGSVLGPLLWNVAYNEVLPTVCGTHSTAVCYADDTLLIIAGDTAEDLEERTRAITSALIQFLDGRGLQLNAAKTEVLLFDDRTGLERLQEEDRTSRPKIWVGDTKIRPTDSMKYLGVILDDEMTWGPHVSYITDKCADLLPRMGVVCRNLYGYSSWARHIMYEALTTALYHYCSSVFYSRIPLLGYRKQVRSVHRRVNINTCRLYKSVSHEAAAVIAGSPPLELRLIERAVLWRLKNMQPVAYWGHLPKFKHRVSTPGNPAAGFIDEHGCFFTLKAVREHFRAATIATWQGEWNATRNGAWTRKLLPDVAKRLENNFRSTFWTGQAISGHGCFGSYLLGRHRRETAACPCGHPEENAEHVLVTCPRFLEERPAEPLNPLLPHHREYMERTMRTLWQLEVAAQRGQTAGTPRASTLHQTPRGCNEGRSADSQDRTPRIEAHRGMP